MIEILFWVFLILAVIGLPWPGAPWGQWPWGNNVVIILLILLLGIAVFGFGLHRIAVP